MRRTLRVSRRQDWRAWLRRHHRTASEVWLVSYKKHTGRPQLRYDEAVEEALCFGWIDSHIQRIDEESFARKFTPRKDESNWSAVNLRRLRAMIEQGRMTKAGLARIDPALIEGRRKPAPQRAKSPPVPPYMKRALMHRPKAWENFQNLAPSYRRAYVHWIRGAVREETRRRRLAEAVSLLERNQKLGMK